MANHIIAIKVAKQPDVIAQMTSQTDAPPQQNRDLIVITVEKEDLDTTSGAAEETAANVGDVMEC